MPKVCIRTFGCQMNAYDTEVAAGILESKGYQITHEFDEAGEVSRQDKSRIFQFGTYAFSDADVFLMNTCSVREHAEDRVYSRLGALGRLKAEKPSVIIGLMGCMVEEHKEKLFKRFPQLDLMIGTRNIAELPSMIEQVQKTRKQSARIRQEGISIEYTDLIKRNSTLHAWLPIMTGCNKVCTFCIVPITRGAEVSMPARDVYREASRLVSEGVKWLTLLGQNVNSYSGNEASDLIAPNRKHASTFPELLEMLCQIPGLERISFTTSHPQDATEELYHVIARNPKISRRFHLPLQSGSDRILKRMKRFHTYDEYKHKILSLRSVVPDIVVTTDIISGFSGEEDEDHLATKRALEELRFAGAYIYKYSVRPQTPASKLSDDVPITIKDKRNRELIDIQNQINKEYNQSYLGEILNVFVEGFSTKNRDWLLGRSDQEKKVVFPGEKTLVGSFVQVKINSLHHETLTGDLVSDRQMLTPKAVL